MSDYVAPVCLGTTKSGKPCTQPAVTHSTRCRFHGGASASTLTQAREHLGKVAEWAVLRLIDLAENATEERVRLDATKSLLSRLGLPEAKDIQVDATLQHNLPEGWQAQQAAAIAEQGRARQLLELQQFTESDPLFATDDHGRPAIEGHVTEALSSTEKDREVEGG